jgi:hemerythrin-like domain-containing protein
MTAKNFKLDMTFMYVFHDALRRDLERIARFTARGSDDPSQVLRGAAGWEMFKKYLRIHHQAEDDAVWPVMYQVLADRPDDLALLDAMEAEHAAIDPLLETVDAALADRDGGSERLGGIVDSLLTNLTGHLRHEETEALALIDATLTEAQWQHFGELQRNKIGDDTRRYLPWLLDDMSAEHVAYILGVMPEPLRNAYHDAWQPAYVDLDPWGTASRPPTP